MLGSEPWGCSKGLNLFCARPTMLGRRSNMGGMRGNAKSSFSESGEVLSDDGDRQHLEHTLSQGCPVAGWLLRL